MEQFKKFRTTAHVVQFFRQELEKLGRQVEISVHPLGGSLIKNPLSEAETQNFMSAVAKEMKRQPYTNRFLYSDESKAAREEREKVLKTHENALKSVLEDLKDDPEKERKYHETLELLLEGIPTPHFWIRDAPVKK